MPDMQNFAVTRKAAAQINTQTHELSAQITDSATGAVLADFTGQNAPVWPAVLNSLTPDQQDQIVGQVAQEVLLMKAGLG